MGQGTVSELNGYPIHRRTTHDKWDAHLHLSSVSIDKIINKIINIPCALARIEVPAYVRIFIVLLMTILASKSPYEITTCCFKLLIKMGLGY